MIKKIKKAIARKLGKLPSGKALLISVDIGFQLCNENMKPILETYYKKVNLERLKIITSYNTIGHGDINALKSNKTFRKMVNKGINATYNLHVKNNKKKHIVMKDAIIFDKNIVKCGNLEIRNLVSRRLSIKEEIEYEEDSKGEDNGK